MSFSHCREPLSHILVMFLFIAALLPPFCRVEIVEPLPHLHIVVYNFSHLNHNVVYSYLIRAKIPNDRDKVELENERK